MKKILSLVLAGLLLVCLVGCSGVLHDAQTVNVVGYKVINSTFADGAEVFVLSQSPRDSGNAQPGNTWNLEATIKGKQKDTTVEIECDPWTVSNEVQAQVKIAKVDGSDIDWASGVNVNAIFDLSTLTVGANYIVEIDMVAATAKFVKK